MKSKNEKTFNKKMKQATFCFR